MYICICKAVTERQICEAIRSGACTRKDITACLKAGTGCGKCNREIRALLRRGESGNRSIPAEQAGDVAMYPLPASGSGQEVCL
ncbi:(2Fe-2S)-binding protein [Methylocaldum sp.]|uniref:(2Fe-2S)-binding protein n=1 Tax=Methylocaldum sp. TaxID=1969727 RepID=UPI002D33CD02|nr:(2Fe-2S)-binding protein [Methylocaldum sp.]HYE37485.1 (2Fe-2S)-binding protein [Methylocaldum sp.]